MERALEKQPQIFSDVQSGQGNGSDVLMRKVLMVCGICHKVADLQVVKAKVMDKTIIYDHALF